eukprot:695114-Rhodomonas_salina.3
MLGVIICEWRQLTFRAWARCKAPMASKRRLKGEGLRCAGWTAKGNLRYILNGPEVTEVALFSSAVVHAVTRCRVT